MKRRWGWCAAAALLAAAAAHGQAEERKSVNVTSETIVKRMDRSGDGKIGHEEFRNAMMRRFSAADANGDGMLSGDEVPTHSIVVNKSEGASNEVKLEDYSAALRPAFDEFDADRDGALAGDEIEALAQARRKLKEATP
ncbi:EF-hand domain-containing protein [Luteimonas sp. SX5]|uniref:EF-hand domain-containing protein n=1 Tax=Luteimonas galliterrae TaxID=2940486 RepID=A0ABT0MG43_9GAMM|nr:EF-hand domain-containing protein [Luteimonas galliterrae]MCL1633854.1 EF-hand domain-containing protein [Luteimonas galliterrae]